MRVPKPAHLDIRGPRQITDDLLEHAYHRRQSIARLVDNSQVIRTRCNERLSVSSVEPAPRAHRLETFGVRARGKWHSAGARRAAIVAAL
ncbi:hypothetical protein EVAR_17233_1 [Eumeta japonica]|uniref:Uncharacterized protein n=1 Tax=Eumeta variegata TaxID=151549 RepID=A0A4C1U980_EUMVA|nr:hypothetical protein EVAR_17233_1 [Eumeta japonica]